MLSKCSDLCPLPRTERNANCADISPYQTRRFLSTFVKDVFLLEFCDTPLSVGQLESEPTPQKKHLLMLPKQGMGSKTIMYLNYKTGPLLVMADLFDTLIQRLSHRLQVIVWSHSKSFKETYGFDLPGLVKRVRSIRSNRPCEDGSLHTLKYTGLIQGSSANDRGDTCEDIHSAGGEEFFEEYSDYEEVGVENDAEESGDLLLVEYNLSKSTVQHARGLDEINQEWVENLPRMSEYSLLMSALSSPNEKSLLVQAGLTPELSSASYVEQDVFASHAENFIFKLSEPFETVFMEQSLFSPKIFSSTFHMLKDQEAILDDVLGDHEGTLEHFKEIIDQAPQFLMLAAEFWRRQIASLICCRSSLRSSTLNQFSMTLLWSHHCASC
ncbi:hypothetical protein GOP47_0022872 [Adiantum capillus-veneris]|uniref:Uncharacterized protein n=1 Tax=Adiantum capillus-veneris TaxID=13818 RepID=A0A9D4Z4Q2_ADICA|nr:hypothetical protein GOP47_0022872 [Adiantum capillus-veneris]